jgi:outer membrane protein assembly factor BamB
VNKIIKIVLFFLILTSCSLDTKSGLWTEKKKIAKEKINKRVILSKKDKKLASEYNSDTVIKLSKIIPRNDDLNQLTNNNKRTNFDGSIQNISKYKFSKIKNFNYFEPEIIFDVNNLIFFENNGNILKFNNASKLLWEKNYYKKIEKKSKPMLYLGNTKEKLIVADNLAKIYAMDIKTGDLLWSKTNLAPFNSQIKIYKNKILIVDFQDVLRCYSIIDGSEIWSLPTQKTFIKSTKKLSIAIKGEKVVFNNSIGDISAVNIESGELQWQVPTQNNLLYENSFSFKTSELVIDRNSIFFSNNRNRFFSIDLDTGITNWEIKINSNIKPTIVNERIFTITNSGLLVILNKKNGKIERATDVLGQLDKINKSNEIRVKANEKYRARKKVGTWNWGLKPVSSTEKTKTSSGRKQKGGWLLGIKPGKNSYLINPIGFVVGKKNIYLTLDNGKMLILDIASGQTISSIKIDNEKISTPFVSNNSLYIAKEKSIIKLN